MYMYTYIDTHIYIRYMYIYIHPYICLYMCTHIFPPRGRNRHPWSHLVGKYVNALKNVGRSELEGDRTVKRRHMGIEFSGFQSGPRANSTGSERRHRG